MKFFNIFKEFKKDFGIAVYNDTQKSSKKVNLKFAGLYATALTIYILSKPIYITSMGLMEKKLRFKQNGEIKKCN